MEEVIELIPDLREYKVTARPKVFRHSAHAFCEQCGSPTMFKIVQHTPPYSGYTGNVVMDVVERCKAGCGEFVAGQVYRNKSDGKLYASNFINLAEFCEYILNKDGDKWNRK